ncbi:MAG: ferritin-like domain-containing protein [Pseudomonadota bacterium]|nr:ferritin-like domain-containing protein [Pseudomonadota bacterium]
MTDSYRSLLFLLLPLVGCPTPEKSDTGETGDTDTDTTDTDTDTDVAETLSETGCYAVDPSLTECPAPADVVLDQVIPATCGATVLTVDGAGELSTGCAYIGGAVPGGWCLYPITVSVPEDPCDYGRPLVVDGRPRLAPLVRARGWTAPAAPAQADAAQAATWARIGLAEHASVASFSRFALDLLAQGAPADLVADAHAAALDEVRHAKLAFGIASAFANDTLGPGPLTLGDLSLSADLAALAFATAREGCVAETLSALQMAEARDRATDPAIRAALTLIARDEARHAALAWRTVRWALLAGGAPVRAALIQAFATPPTLPGDDASGLLPPPVARAAILRGWAEVVVPAATALLGGVPAVLGGDRPAA